jgi:protein-disulfide isomerase
MQRIRAAGIALAFALAWGALGAGPVPPKLDKGKWENFLRYAEGYVAAVKFDIEDPKPTSFPGFFQVIVHLSSGESKLDRSYYVTADGQSILNGAVWDLRQGPFAENLKHLPNDGYSFGPADAPVNIVVFSDFECPFCSELAKTMRKELPKKYPDTVRVVFKDFPLASIHPWARAAAESAHCLGDQKPEAFWAFHDWIFEHQKEVNPGNLRDKTMLIASEQKLDNAKVTGCLDSHAPAAAIDKSIQVGRLLQVQQTPSFYVNGRSETGALPWDKLSALIDFELSRPKEFSTPAAEKCCEVVLPKVGGK